VANQPLVSHRQGCRRDTLTVERNHRATVGTKGDLVKVGTALVEFSEGVEADTGTIVGEVQRSEPAPRGEAQRPCAAAGALHLRAGAQARCRPQPQGSGPGE
jgi:hypothetical protein